MRFILFYLIVLVIGCKVNAQSRGDLERQRTLIMKEIEETESVLTTIQKNKLESLEVLSLLNRKIDARHKLIDNITKDAAKVDNKISDIESQIRLLTADVYKYKQEYGHVIWQSYLNRQKSTHLMYILSAKDINQSYRRLKYLKQYSEYRKRQINNIKNVQIDLSKMVKELEGQKREKLILIGKSELETKNLGTEVQSKKNVINSLKAKEGELTSQIRKKNSEADRIKSKIENLIRKEIEDRKVKAVAARKTGSKANLKASAGSAVAESNIGFTPEEINLSSGFKDNRGKLPWPTEKGLITGFFGERSHPVYKSVKIRNNGIDIRTVDGASARAIFDGEVRYIIPILGANYSVLIRHGSYYTVYTNIVELKVKIGDKVKTKEILGKVFTDNSTNSTILHLEVWENLNRLDPILWLNKN